MKSELEARVFLTNGDFGFRMSVPQTFFLAVVKHQVTPSNDDGKSHFLDTERRAAIVSLSVRVRSCGSRLPQLPWEAGAAIH